MHILLIPGDGIGPEVIGAAAEILRAVVPDVELHEASAGWGAFEATGAALPQETLELARAVDAILFGAVASPSHSVPGYRSPIVQLRRELDLYANIRPVMLRRQESGVRSQESGGGSREAGGTLRYALRATRDVERHADRSVLSPRHPVTPAPRHPGTPSLSSLVVVRENTEGLYAGRERLEDDGETAIAERVITRRASERITRTAFELARRRSLLSALRSPLVTIAHKANVLRVSDGLFRNTALAVAAEFPDVEVEEMLVDVAAMRLAQTPERFDVLVTTNMFGDILSDVACIHGGGLGMAASANLGAGRALFEPVHGAAPDIAGRGAANPLAAIECVAMLLEWRERHEAAAAVRAACVATTQAGITTPDLGGTATTREVTAAVLHFLHH